MTATTKVRSSMEAQIRLRFGTAFTIEQVSDRLGISRRQVQAHIDAGDLVAVNVGRGPTRRDLRVLEADLDAFVHRRRTGASTHPPSEKPKQFGRPTPLGPKPTFLERNAALIAASRSK